MKVLRPEINALNDKYGNDRAKKQQETMKLYSKAGANPMAGCVPSLLQLPVFLGLFYFFPVAFPFVENPFYGRRTCRLMTPF